VDNPRAFLSTVVTRLCLDQIKSARVRREHYIGSWLPEPVLDDEPLDGAGVLSGFFPGTLGPLYDRMRQFPAVEFLGLLVAWRLFPYIAAPGFRLMRVLLYG